MTEKIPEESWEIQEKKIVMDIFSSREAQELYIQEAEKGLWLGEQKVIEEYFIKDGKTLDLGCGTGRTTIPIQDMGFDVVGVDISENMIKNAKIIAKQKGLEIAYNVGDATDLEFDNETFDNLIFSNQGITQIPTKNLREKALKEISRVLKKDGIFVTSTHKRVMGSEFTKFWIKEWFRFYVLQTLGLTETKKDSFGDIDFEEKFLNRKGKGEVLKQSIHIPNIHDFISDVEKYGFSTQEVIEDMQRYPDENRKTPPVVYIFKKIS